MSHPGARSMKPVPRVWVASAKESRLHLAGQREAEEGAESLLGLCEHFVRSVVGAWEGSPPHIQGYGLCEPCCVLAKIFPVLTQPAMSFDEALSRALDSYRPRAHSVDRPTAVIPRVVDVEMTDRLPVLWDGLDADGWPVDDPDLDQPGLGVGAPAVPTCRGRRLSLLRSRASRTGPATLSNTGRRRHDRAHRADHGPLRTAGSGLWSRASTPTPCFRTSARRAASARGKTRPAPCTTSRRPPSRSTRSAAAGCSP